jgi:hypothetical protein
MEHRKKFAPVDPQPEVGTPLPDRSDLAKLYPSAKPVRIAKTEPVSWQEEMRTMRRSLIGRPLRLGVSYVFLLLVADYLMTVYFPPNFVNGGILFLPVVVICLLFLMVSFFLLSRATIEALEKRNLGGISYLAIYLLCLVPAWLPLRFVSLSGFIPGYVPNIGSVAIYAATFAALGAGLFWLLGCIFSQTLWRDGVRVAALLAVIAACMGGGLFFAFLRQ